MAATAAVDAPTRKRCKDALRPLWPFHIGFRWQILRYDWSESEWRKLPACDESLTASWKLTPLFSPDTALVL